MQGDMIDLFRYHDLTQRLSEYSRVTAEHLRGDTEDVRIVDSEPAMLLGETERCRVAGALTVTGPRSTGDGDDATLGLVLNGASMIVVTDQRLIISVLSGATQLGEVDDSVLHMMAFPWDLVDLIEMPARKSIADRIAGGRTIRLSCLMVPVAFELSPVKRVEIDGREHRMTDLDVFHRVVDVAADARRAVAPASEHSRLDALKRHDFVVEDGDWVAWITDEDSKDTPAHLEGRLVERG